MVEIKRATLNDKEEVYQWYQIAEREQQKHYEDDHLTVFFRKEYGMNQEVLKKILEDTDKNYVYFAYENGEIIGILYYYMITGKNHNINVPVLYAYNEESYQGFLELILASSKQNKQGIIKIRPIFPKEKTLIAILEKNGFELRRTSFTIEDLSFERKNKQASYKISFLNKKELKQAQSYYDSLEETEKEFLNLDLEDCLNAEAGRILIAKNKKKIVGLLLGTISDHRYIVSYLDICVGDNEQIKHDLLNEFKRISLKEQSDDLFVETKSFAFKEFLKKESFTESYSTYFKRLSTNI